MLRSLVFRFVMLSGSLKANSHIPCRYHAAPMPFPCPAVPLRVYSVSFPFNLHSAAVFDSHMPCHDHAVLKATSQSHGTTRHGHDMVCVN
jgi:hypothetical protein